jgi:hypothetical protein
MSKNTGTSELINYFDLGVNGDVGIAGSLDINTIANATTDTDTFLVSDTGIIKYRTGAQLLSDIGAAPAVAGGYVPYTGATTNVDLGVYNLTASAIIANGSGSNSGIVHLESNAIHSLVNGYGSIASGTTNQFNLYQTTGAGVFRGAILSLNSITEFATRTFTLPDADGTIALTSNIPANPVGGTGTTNYLPKFTGASTIANSNLINDASGNLGLGVTPSVWASGTEAALQVGNTSIYKYSTYETGYSVNAYFNAGWKYISNDIASQYKQSSGAHYWYYAPSGTAGNAISFTQAMTLTSGGNLLVGTTTDNGARLQVSGSTTTMATITSSGTASGLQLTNTGSTASSWIIQSDGGAVAGQAALRFYSLTASAYRMSIDGSGNVGIGTASPSEILHVYKATTFATILLQNGNNSAYSLYQAKTGNSDTWQWGCWNDNSYRVGKSGIADYLMISSTGNVLIGTTTDAGYKLRVNGTISSDSVYYSLRSSGNLVHEVQNGGTAVNRTYTAYSSVPMNGGKFRLAFTGYDRQCCLIKISVSGGWAASNTSNRHFAMIFNVQPLVNSSGSTIFVTAPTALLSTNISTGNVTATSLGGNNYTIDIVNPLTDVGETALMYIKVEIVGQHFMTSATVV